MVERPFERGLRLAASGLGGSGSSSYALPLGLGCSVDQRIQTGTQVGVPPCFVTIRIPLFPPERTSEQESLGDTSKSGERGSLRRSPRPAPWVACALPPLGV